jgi:hypothetical protein
VTDVVGTHRVDVVGRSRDVCAGGSVCEAAAPLERERRPRPAAPATTACAQDASFECRARHRRRQLVRGNCPPRRAARSDEGREADCEA